MNKQVEELTLFVKQTFPSSSVIPLGGKSGASIKVIDNSGCSFVLRKQNKQSNALGAKQTPEVKILFALENLSWSPNIIEIKQEYFLLSWIEGKVLSRWTNRRIEQLAKLLSNPLLYDRRILNSLNDDLFDVTEQLPNLIKILPENRRIFGTDKLGLLPKIIWQYDTIAHHDIHLDNILVTAGDELAIIDWEYAALSSRYFEVAMIFVNNNWDKSQQSYFLYCYLQLLPGQFLEQEILDKHILWATLFNDVWYQVQRYMLSTSLDLLEYSSSNE